MDDIVHKRAVAIETKDVPELVHREARRFAALVCDDLDRVVMSDGGYGVDAEVTLNLPTGVRLRFTATLDRIDRG